MTKQLSSTLLQRQVNNVEFDTPRMSFNDLCLGVTQTPWGQKHELTVQDVQIEIKRHKTTTVALQPVPVNLDNLMDRLFTPKPRPLCVCYGMGVDSTALLIHLARMYHSEPNKCPQYRPDIITFADTGNEKRETYAYEVVIQDYLKQMGFPPVTTVRYKPNPNRVKHGMYHTLEQNCLTNGTLPSMAFNFRWKRCSLKAKVNPQNKYRADQEMVQECWDAGLQAICAIGYDAGPKDARRADIMDDEQYEYWYPLVQLGWNRERCIEEIKAEGLPGWADWRGLKWVKKGGQPVKSACWFCPSIKPDELDNFSRTEHGRDYLRAIVRMEATAAPQLTSINGLWGSGPSMTSYIHENELLNGKPALPVLQQGDHGFTGCEQCVGCF
tara:strand:+ start:677 stop:1825 length:1149 start_codon:yes stop_codon:yes gene_type:complete